MLCNSVKVILTCTYKKSKELLIKETSRASSTLKDTIQNNHKQNISLTSHSNSKAKTNLPQSVANIKHGEKPAKSQYKETEHFQQSKPDSHQQIRTQQQPNQHTQVQTQTQTQSQSPSQTQTNLHHNPTPQIDLNWWKERIQAFGERNGLSYLSPQLLEEALNHKVVIANLSPSFGQILCSERLVYVGYNLAELQLTDYYMSVLPRGAHLAARICLRTKNLYSVGQALGVDKLLHDLYLASNSFEAYSILESRIMERAVTETVLALVAAIHQSKQKPVGTVNFTHKYLALPLTLNALISEHHPKRLLDSYLHSRINPSQPKPWAPQTQPPEQAHSKFAVYRVVEQVKNHVVVGVYIDGKLVTTDHGSSIPEAEQMAAIRALEILRSQALQKAIDSE